MRPWKAPPHEVFTTLPAEKRTFSLFLKLPYELQHMIWLEALSQERLIKVHLGGSWDDGRYVGPYKITLRGPRETNAPILNQLLLTCSDSRRIAKRFYRVQMACEYHSRKDEWKKWYPGVLYLCPELDIVHIDGFEHFVEFATDVYNNDRDRKGLLNLAIGERTFSNPYNRGLGYRKREWEKFLDAIKMDQSRRNYEEHLILDLPYQWSDDTLVPREHCLDFIHGAYENLWESGLEVTGNLPPSVDGFWVVPMEAFQEDEDGEIPDWVDIRDYPPELCVAHRG